MDNVEDRAKAAVSRVRENYAQPAKSRARQERYDKANEAVNDATSTELDEAEAILMVAGVVDTLILEGVKGANEHCKREGYSHAQSQLLVDRALKNLEEITSRTNEQNLAMARARYEKLVADNLITDPRTALRAQAMLDRINGLGATNSSSTNVVQTMVDIIGKITDDNPEPREVTVEDDEAEDEDQVRN